MTLEQAMIESGNIGANLDGCGLYVCVEQFDGQIVITRGMIGYQPSSYNTCSSMEHAIQGHLHIRESQSDKWEPLTGEVQLIPPGPNYRKVKGVQR